MGFPFSCHFEHILRSFRAFSTVSFRAPLLVISSEARNLEPKAKISQSPPLTSFGGRSFEMTRGALPLTFVRGRSFEMTRGAACFRTFVGNDKTRLSWRQKRSRLVVDARWPLWKEMPRHSHNCSGNRSQGRCYCRCCSMTLIILSTVRLTGVGVMYFCPISTTFPANISTSVCLPASIS